MYNSHNANHKILTFSSYADSRTHDIDFNIFHRQEESLNLPKHISRKWSSVGIVYITYKTLLYFNGTGE